MLLHFILCLFTCFLTTSRGIMDNIARQGCETQCGNVTVPYPFGIGKNNNCSLDNDDFYLTCNSSKLFIADTDIQVHDISDSELRIFTGVSYRCYNQSGIIYDEHKPWASLSPVFTFSEKNKLTVVGCDDYALITGKYGADFSSGCFGLCSKPSDVLDDGQCLGTGCCQTSIPKGLRFYNVTLDTFKNHSDVLEHNGCGSAFLGEQGTFQFGGARDLYNSSALFNRVSSTVPVVLDWVIAPDKNCSYGDIVCEGNSSCYDAVDGGYRCICNKGYEGNPYLDRGCQGAVLGTGILVLAIWMYKVFQKRKDRKRREIFFKRNGGLLLQQQKLNGEHAIERTRIFTAIELDKATDQYNKNRIVGRGGQGTVYKGMLPDGKIVAVKKSILVDECQVEPFINEVFLLSQISHKNVVKLLGCCLETEVPILVYEFVSNGDLFQFIHDENYDFPSSWSMRLQIATEVAGALAYMHSATSIPIYHRDIKSSNILLDEKFRAKLSDFGISKSVLGDQTHLSTLVKGTYGYIDPEYFQSNQFTEKSDVYSFGIVLVELLTGKKPIFSIGVGESRSLATLVLSTEEGLLLENIDDRVLDGPKEQLIAVAMLAKTCLNLNGTLRPTMKQVVVGLEGIRSSH